MQNHADNRKKKKRKQLNFLPGIKLMNILPFCTVRRIVYLILVRFQIFQIPKRLDTSIINKQFEELMRP